MHHSSKFIFSMCVCVLDVADDTVNWLSMIPKSFENRYMMYIVALFPTHTHIYEYCIYLLYFSIMYACKLYF